MFDGPSSATFVFTNSGKQAVSVEKVSLERFDGDTTSECTSRRDQNVRRYYIFATKPAQAPSKSVDRALDAVKLVPTKARRVFKSIELTHIFLDNKEANSTALLVDAQSAKILSFEFSGDFLHEESRSIYCFEITVYDRTGERHTKSLPGWTTTHEGEATLLAARTSFKPVTLLPPE
jgi:hypothetical protein